MIQPRATVRDSIRFNGRGLHSGEPVVMAVHPATDGIRFRCGSHAVRAHPTEVTDVRRCTRLGEIATVEHVMSALAGCGVTDATIELTAPEPPGVDGSARPFVDGLRSVGFERIGEREFPDLFKRVFFQDDKVKVAIGQGDGHWRYEFEIDGRWPGLQVFEMTSVIDDYADGVAPARTIVLEEEIEIARAHGLGRGLDETSVLIVGRQGYANEARFADEIARHKTLDLIGDLYLCGVSPSLLNVVAERSGHASNVKTALRLAHMLRIN